MARRASPGEGRPYQRSADGRWVVVVRDQDGRRRYLYAWSRSDAIAKRDEAMSRVRGGLTATPARLTVGRALTDWLDDRRGKVRPSTWVTYEVYVRVHLSSLARVPLAKFTPSDGRRWVREREAETCAPATIRNALVVLRMALRQAVDDGLISRNVASLVAAPKIDRREVEVYQDDEPRRLLAAAKGDELGALWTVLLGTGMRLGEALGLRWSDVDLEAPGLTVARALRPVDRRFRAEGQPRLQLVEPKTDESRRSLALPAFVATALEEHRRIAGARPRNVAGLVFTSPRGTPLDPRNTSRAWYAFLDDAGIRHLRIHDLRHTAISLALAGGATLEDVRRMAGHATIRETSDTYGHLVRARSREVASMMDRAVGE